MNASEKPTSESRAGTFAALSHPNYRLWFFGQTISLVGTWMQSTAQGYLVYTLTGSAAYLGVIAFVGGLPTWLFTLFGGVIADRIPRRSLLVITQTIMMALAGVMALLVYLNAIRPWHIAVLAFLLGVANAFDAPPRLSFIRELVNREHMTNAIALNATMFNIGTVIGPAVAGLTYAAVGPAWCFTINAISFLAVIGALLLMRLESSPMLAKTRGALSELKEGLKYVIGHQAIRGLIINLGFVSIFGFGLVALIPAWAVGVLHGDVTTNGWLLSARGVGSLIGALTLATIGSRIIRGKWWAIGSLMVPIFWFLFSLVTKLQLSLILIGIIGLFTILMVNLTNALVQTLVEDNLRGRVMGIYTMVFFGLTPVGSLLAGFSATHIGPQITVAISGVALFVAAIFTWYKMPYLRKLV